MSGCDPGAAQSRHVEGKDDLQGPYGIVDVLVPFNFTTYPLHHFTSSVGLRNA